MELWFLFSSQTCRQNTIWLDLGIEQGVGRGRAYLILSKKSPPSTPPLSKSDRDTTSGNTVGTLSFQVCERSSGFLNVFPRWIQLPKGQLRGRQSRQRHRGFSDEPRVSKRSGRSSEFRLIRLNCVGVAAASTPLCVAVSEGRPQIHIHLSAPDV